MEKRESRTIEDVLHIFAIKFAQFQVTCIKYTITNTFLMYMLTKKIVITNNKMFKWFYKVNNF